MANQHISRFPSAPLLDKANHYVRITLTIFVALLIALPLAYASGHIPERAMDIITISLAIGLGILAWAYILRACRHLACWLRLIARPKPSQPIRRIRASHRAIRQPASRRPPMAHPTPR